jgi:hypothetical protein
MFPCGFGAHSESTGSVGKGGASGEHLDRKRHQNMESIPNSPLHWSLTGKTVSSTADITTLLEMIPDPADSRCDAGRPRSS